MMILGFLAICFLVYYLIEGKNKYYFTGSKKSDAEEILKLRFVNGEIDETTYLQMQETIK